jgi:hypothetical protein
MLISLDLPHVFYPGSNPKENALALRIMLDALIALNTEFLREHRVPQLYASGVRYGRTTVWDTIPALYNRTYGDCKSLTAALVAERRFAGLPADPVFRWIRNPDNSTDYHILVAVGGGRFEDPSKVLGMNRHNIRVRA